MNKDSVVALYARVSSDQQAKDDTVASQVESIKERIHADGETLFEEMIYVDAGVSGATLVRPELERLRDNASLGMIQRLYLLSPDRLSRKYAHQVLLMEEFSESGVEVQFLNHTKSTTPEAELLLQMQGMFSEYERAKIMERHRRGKLHRAKGGSVNVLSTAPYGYQYVRKQLNGEPAQYLVNLAQAATVKNIFHWIGVERLSIGAVCRRLGEAQIPTKTGKSHWDRSVVWGMLQNPAYMGKAAFGKTKVSALRPRVRAPKHSADTPKRPYSTIRTAPQSWIDIPVPQIVSEELFQAVHHQLEENRRRARQGRRGAAYLLQGLTVCGHCHYAYYGKKVSSSSAKGKGQYAYYRCTGSDAYRFAGQRICDNPQVRTQRLDELVWEQVVDALQHPKRLRNEYERRLELLQRGKRTTDDTAAYKKQKSTLEKGKSRLIDSYASGVIEKEDFEPKIHQIKIKLQQLAHQIEQSNQQEVTQFELFLVINRLEEFAKKVDVKLASPDFQTQRDIIRALVKRVEIHKEEIVVVFRIYPDSGVDDGNNSSGTKPDAGGSIMQGRKRRTRAVAMGIV
jgi:site-specific DNA recombinase